VRVRAGVLEPPLDDPPTAGAPLARVRTGDPFEPLDGAGPAPVVPLVRVRGAETPVPALAIAGCEPLVPVRGAALAPAARVVGAVAEPAAALPRGVRPRGGRS